MEVCEVCGAFLIVGDAQSRIDDHLTGKQHVGYAKLRSALEEIVVSNFVKSIFEISVSVSVSIMDSALHNSYFWIKKCKIKYGNIWKK